MMGRHGAWLRMHSTGHTLFAARNKLKRKVDRWVRQAIQADRPKGFLGKRSAPRYTPWPESLELEFGGEMFVGYGRDISAGGVGIMCRHKFHRDDIVQLRCVGEETWIPIRVRHCTSTFGSYKTGAQLWST